MRKIADGAEDLITNSGKTLLSHFNAPRMRVESQRLFDADFRGSMYCGLDQTSVFTVQIVFSIVIVQ